METTLRLSRTGGALVVLLLLARATPCAEPDDAASATLAAFTDAKGSEATRARALRMIEAHPDRARAGKALLREATSTRDGTAFYWCCRALLAIDKKKHGTQVEKLIVARIRHFLDDKHQSCHAAIEAAFKAGDEEAAKRLADGHKLMPRTVELLAECGSAASAGTLREVVGGKGQSRLRSSALQALASVAVADADSMEATMTVMLSALAGDSPQAQRAAGEAIPALAKRNGLQDKIARKLITNLDADPGEPLAERIVRALGRIDSRASRKKIRTLIRTERRKRVLAEALKAAGALRLKEAERDILRISKSRRYSQSIRELALRVLGKVGSESTADQLVDALDSDDARLSAAAHGSLRQITRQNLPPSADVWVSTAQRTAKEFEVGAAEETHFETKDLSPPRSRPTPATVAPQASFWMQWRYPIIGIGSLGVLVLLLLARSLLIRRQATTIEAKRGKWRRGVRRM
jgi:hypothetical protein